MDDEEHFSAVTWWGPLQGVYRETTLPGYDGVAFVNRHVSNEEAQELRYLFDGARVLFVPDRIAAFL